MMSKLVSSHGNNWIFAAEDFSGAQGAKREHVHAGYVIDAQRSVRLKATPPRGLSRKCRCRGVATRSQPHFGDTPSPRLAETPFPVQQIPSYFWERRPAASTEDRRVPASARWKEWRC